MARQLPGLGLEAFWNLGESGWKDGMDNNIQLLSASVQASILGTWAQLPEPDNLPQFAQAWNSTTNQMYSIVGKDAPRNWSLSPVQPRNGWLYYDVSRGMHVVFKSGVFESKYVEDAPKNGRPHVRQDGGWIAQDYLISTFIPAIADLNVVLAAYILPEQMTLKAGAPGSVARCQTAGGLQTKVFLHKNGTQVGTITFAAGNANGTFSVSGNVEFAQHDILSIVSDATEVASAEGISVLLRLEM